MAQGRRVSVLTASILVVAALLLDACSPTASSESTGPSDAGNAANAGNSAAGGQPQVGPLDAMLTTAGFGPDGESPEDRLEFAVTAFRQQEEQIAACMAELGFEYLPNIQGSPVLLLPDTPPPTGRDFAQTYGFGISVELPISEFGHLVFSGDPAADPNIELVAGMSDAEAAAWREALYGTNPDGSFLGDYDTETSPACLWQVFRNQSASGEEFSAIRAEIDTFFNGILNDLRPEFTPLNAEWSACMAEQGFGQFRSPRQAETDLIAEWDAIPRTLNQATSMWDINPTDQAAFTERELLVATTSYDCQVQVQFHQRHNEISFELQDEFINQHQNELEAYVAYWDARHAAQQ